MHTHRHLQQALNARHKAYRAELKACRREFAVSRVHDLRVAIRRLLALIDLLRALLPHAHFQKVRKALKAQLTKLNALRDTQMMLASISGLRKPGLDLRPFRRHLLQAESRLLDDVRGQVESLRPAKADALCEAVRAHLSDADITRLQLFVALDAVYSALLRKHRLITPDRPDTIHRTRVCFKTFRYMFEVAHPLLPDCPKACLRRIHAYQDSMGAIQDADVLLRALQRFGAPEAILRYGASQRERLISEFIAGKSELRTFWRLRTDRPFPWEETK